ncbi:hypothetical protein LINPERPRIM_LOCUS17393 [Linum perenne]
MSLIWNVQVEDTRSHLLDEASPSSDSLLTFGDSVSVAAPAEMTLSDSVEIPSLPNLTDSVEVVATLIGLELRTSSPPFVKNDWSSVRGLGFRDKRFMDYQRIKALKPLIVCLQETKLEDVDAVLVRSLVGELYWNWSFKPSLGASGGCSLVAVERVCSDHKLLILECGTVEMVIRPWRFKNMWLEDERFGEILEEFWLEQPTGCFKMLELGRKLKRLKVKLKEWNATVFKNINLQVRALLEEVERLDQAEEGNSLEEEDRLHRMNVKCQLDRLWKLEEISWRQKAKERWTEHVDRNTRFFHLVANANHRRNALSGLRVQGVQVFGQGEIANAAVNFYKALYTETVNARPFPRGGSGLLHLSLISEGVLLPN